MPNIQEIKAELKRLKIVGISRKNKDQLLQMLPKGNKFKPENVNKKVNVSEHVKQIIIPKGIHGTLNIYITQNSSGKIEHEVKRNNEREQHEIKIPMAPPPPPPGPPLAPGPPNIVSETPEEKAARQERARLKKEEVNEQKNAQPPPGIDIEELKRSIAARQKRKLEGKGIGEWLSNIKDVIFNPSKALLKMPKEVSEQLQKYGNDEIKTIYICRSPLGLFNKMLLQFITLGGYKAAAADYGYYDNVFHLYVVVKLISGKLLLIERNHRVFIKDTTEKKIKIKDVITLNITKKLTLNEMFNNAMKADDNLFYYNPITHNCQNFVSIFLNSSVS